MSPSGSSGSTTSSGRILAVDDQAANLRVVGILLGRNGYEVVPAANGAEALAAAQAHTPDLILLDMMMPGMDGFELLAALRALPALRGVPAVFLTAAHDRDLLLRAFDAGAVDYVTKPFMPEELLARVNRYGTIALVASACVAWAARPWLMNRSATDVNPVIWKLLEALHGRWCLMWREGQAAPAAMYGTSNERLVYDQAYTFWPMMVLFVGVMIFGNLLCWLLIRRREVRVPQLLPVWW